MHTCSRFCLSILIFKVQRKCPLSPHLGLWRTLEVPDWGLASCLDSAMVTGFLYDHDLNFDSLYVALEISGGSWMGLASWSLFGYCHWSLMHQWSKFWLSILILNVQRTSLSFKSSFGALEDAEGSWLGLGILILIWTWSLVFDTLQFRVLALNLGF